jgi:protein phosphatase
VLVAGAYAAWSWSQHQYYVGAAGQDVAIYRGLPQDIGPVSMSRVYEVQDLPLTQLPEYSREQVRSSITADNLADARAKVGALRSQAVGCAGPSAAPRQTPPPAATGESTGTLLAGRTTPSTQPSTQPSTRPTARPTARPTTPATRPATTPATPRPTSAATTPAAPTTAATPTPSGAPSRPADCAGAAS